MKLIALSFVAGLTVFVAPNALALGEAVLEQAAEIIDNLGQPEAVTTFTTNSGFSNCSNPTSSGYTPQDDIGQPAETYTFYASTTYYDCSYQSDNIDSYLQLTSYPGFSGCTSLTSSFHRDDTAFIDDSGSWGQQVGLNCVAYCNTSAQGNTYYSITKDGWNINRVTATSYGQGNAIEQPPWICP